MINTFNKFKVAAAQLSPVFMNKKKTINPKIVPIHHECLGHLTLCFLKDGTVNFYPENVLEPEYLSQEFLKLCQSILSNPPLAKCAFRSGDH